MQAVLVTTAHRGVFFGMADKGANKKKRITLKNARNCIYWPSSQGGVFGLAAVGPVGGSRIGAEVPELTLRDITSVTHCTDAAREAWISAKVYRG